MVSFLGGISNGHLHQDPTEIQRLRRELREEQERVQRLSAQLTTNVSIKRKKKETYIHTGEKNQIISLVQ